MKVTVNQKDLNGIVGTAIRSTNAKGSIPILACILLEARGGRIYATGADYSQTIVSHCPADVEEEGSVAVPGRKLTDLVSALGGGDVLLEGTEDGPQRLSKLAVTWGLSEYEILGLSAEEFPAVPELEEGDALAVPADAFALAVQRGGFCASVDPSRPQLCGIHLWRNGANLNLESAEMARLSVVSVPVDPGDEWRAIVPAVTITEAVKAAKDQDEIRIAATRNRIRFDAGNTSIVSTLIDGKFPNFSKVIPRDQPRGVTIERESLMSACRRVLSMADGKGMIELELSSGKLTLRTEMAGTGKGTDRIEADVRAGGDDFRILMDGNKLLQFLSVVDDPRITLEFGAGPLVPMTAHPTEGWTVTQMPMQPEPNAVTAEKAKAA